MNQCNNNKAMKLIIILREKDDKIAELNINQNNLDTPKNAS